MGDLLHIIKRVTQDFVVESSKPHREAIKAFKLFLETEAHAVEKVTFTQKGYLVPDTFFIRVDCN